MDLAAAGPIAELIGGQITASILTAESAGGIDLVGDNRIGVLVVTNDGGDVVVRNLGDLEIAEIIQLSGGDVLVTSDGAIAVSGTITTDEAVGLTAARSIAQVGAGRIAAASLSTESAGGLQLGGDNAVGVLTATNDGGNVVVRNLGALEIAELIQLSGGDVLVTNDGVIVISGAAITEDMVSLTSTGSIAQVGAGRIAAASLWTESAGGLRLGGDNVVSLLALTNDGGDVVVHNLGDLEIAELIQLSGGDVRVTNDGAIAISGTITAENAVDLVSTGTIAETGAGQIMALILTTQSVGGLDLGGANQIGTILVTNDGGDVVVRNLGDLEIAGISQLSGGDVRVTNDGKIEISGVVATADGRLDGHRSHHRDRRRPDRGIGSDCRKCRRYRSGRGQPDRRPRRDQRRRRCRGSQSGRLGDCRAHPAFRRQRGGHHRRRAGCPWSDHHQRCCHFDRRRFHFGSRRRTVVAAEPHDPKRRRSTA